MGKKTEQKFLQMRQMSCPSGHKVYESLLASFNAQGKHIGVRPMKAALGEPL